MFKVLLVDDMKQILDSLEHSINWKLYNMEVAATAFNGSEALDILNHTHIDLVITDIQMGRYGGLELCQNIVDHFPHIKIIIMSGYAEFSYAQKAIKFGVLGYCLKPLEYEEICRLLVRANQILRAGSSQPTYDDLLDAIDSNDKSHILETLKQLGFEQSWCYLSVSTGSQRISVEQKDGLWVRIGRAQYAYITYEPMPQKEIDRLLESPDDSVRGVRDRAILEVLYATGIRVSELIDLNMDSINLRMGFVTCDGQGSRARIIPLGRPARAALENYISGARLQLVRERTEEEALFVNQYGRRITRQGLWKILRDYGEKAELSHSLTPHTLRNSFAVHMLQNGADLKSLQELMGHDDITATQVYLSATKSRLKDVYDRAHPRA